MAEPVFFAASYNNQTFEFLELPVGTGPPLYSTPAGLLLPDHLGVYRSFGAGDAPIHGARWDGGVAYADNGSGTLLSPLPSLYAAPALENTCLHSADLTQVSEWALQNTPIITFDQPGLTGAPNTASYIEDDATTQEKVTQTTTIPSDTNPNTVRAYILKDSDVSRFPAIGFSITGAFNDNLHINTMTGAAVEQVGGQFTAFEVNDADPWWEILIEAPNASQTQLLIAVIPAIGTTIGVVDNNAVGSIVHANAELHEGKTIAEVRGSAPIITAGTAASTVAVKGSYPGANHDQQQGAYFAEYAQFHANDGGVSVQHGVVQLFANASAMLFNMTNTSGVNALELRIRDDSAIAVQLIPGYSAEQFVRIACPYNLTDGLKQANSEGVFSEEAYVGWRTPDRIEFGGATSPSTVFPFLIRNIRRYDLNYVDAKAIIDELMLGTDGGFPLASVELGNRMDDKRSTLLTLTGETDGHIDDLEVAWLKQELSA